MVQETIQTDAGPNRIVNNFSITFGTINGSGSATANITLLRAIFKMGIPVSGKNIFPSNIQGQPTWYTIRVNKHGYLARSETIEMVVAMNPASFEKEVKSLSSGGVLFYSREIVSPVSRTDITLYPIPVREIVKTTDTPSHLKEYISNMVYVGVLAQMIGIPLEKIHEALDFHFMGKEKATETNYKVVETAAIWAKENLEKKDPYFVEFMEGTRGKILTLGNTAAAIGAIYGGVQFAAWYPITPATSLSESLSEYLPKLRKDPETGKCTYAVAQAEDEISAIGMVIGAGWAGLRSMTSTSGPGLSLMSEYLGLAYYSEIPIVVWNVQRVGPSTGLPTRTAQGDITQAYFISHGDTQFVILFPGSVNECFEFGWQALDIAERLQTPVLVLSDMDLGMNHWMTDEFVYPNRPIDRGKILWEDDLEKMLVKLNGKWGRYLDIDGDGIPYRTLPGNKHPKSGYLGRGTGHDEFGRYTEDAQNWEHGMNRLLSKFETAKTYIPKPIIERQENAKIGIISCGSTDMAIIEARDLLQENGLPTDYMRIRGVPFISEVNKFICDHTRSYVVELNRDGQLRQLLLIDNPECGTKLIQATHHDGLPITAQKIIDIILAQEAI